MKNHTKTEIIDLLIVGGGPAGMTAAIYGARAAMNTVVLEKEAPGGKMIKTYYVQNYPGYDSILGPDLAMKMYKQATATGAKFIFQEVRKITKDETKNLFTVELANNEVLKAWAVILATGTKEVELGVPGEKELYAKGVSYCAVCDGALYKDQPVAVAGGGYSAVTESLFLTQYASKVYVIVRKPYFRADKNSVEHLKKIPEVEFLMESKIIKINGDKKVESIIVQSNRDGSEKELKVGAVFPYIGANPLTQMVEDLKITNSQGYISHFNAKLETKVQGLFVAGDVRDVALRQIAVATGDGAIAGQMAIEYLQTLQ